MLPTFFYSVILLPALCLHRAKLMRRQQHSSHLFVRISLQFSKLNFPVSLADGRVYRVLLSIVAAENQQSTSITLSVDNVQLPPVTVAGVLADCEPSADCVLYVGQRSANTVKTRYGEPAPEHKCLSV